MKGLETARRYYEEFAAEALRSEFSHLMPHIAAGLCGAGSECMGYDDEVSRDHDFEPGFCLFIPGEEIVSRRDAFLLQRFYDKLPKEYGGLRRSLVAPVGGRRLGVIRTADLLASKTGSPYLPMSTEQWLRTPEQSLIEAVNGEIWYDGSGEITALRKYLSQMPEDIRLKKLASYLLQAAQSGQYNYSRCLAHGESAAAQLAADEFVRAAVHVLLLLHGRYTPYYKWAFRALREAEPGAADGLEAVLKGPDAGRADRIEEICAYIIGLLQAQDLTDAACGELEKHAYSVNDRIEDAFLRNADIFAGLNG